MAYIKLIKKTRTQVKKNIEYYLLDFHPVFHKINNDNTFFKRSKCPHLPTKISQLLWLHELKNGMFYCSCTHIKKRKEKSSKELKSTAFTNLYYTKAKERLAVIHTWCPSSIWICFCNLIYMAGCEIRNNSQVTNIVPTSLNERKNTSSPTQ